MTGNRQNQSDALRSKVPGEKPVINEEFQDNSPIGTWKWDFPKSLGETKKPKDTAASAATVEEDTGLAKGIRLFRVERWEDALDELLLVEGGNLNSEEHAELAYYIGLCYSKLERFDEAPLYLEQFIAEGSDPLRVYQCRIILAYIYIKTDRAKMAGAELERLLGSGFESVSLYNTLAYAAYAQKQSLKAIEWYEKTLDIDPDNLTAMNSLGYILADTRMDTLKGLRLCRKAADKKPQNAAYLDSLGWALYQCGKIPDARRWMRRALDLSPHEPEIKKHFKIVTGEAL